MSIGNVLFLGGGRRISLARLFQQAGLHVVAYESDLNAPIYCIGSSIVKGLKWNDVNIKEHIYQTCVDSLIDIVIPLQDQAVEILSCMSINGVVCDSITAKICFDKKMFEDTFNHDILRHMYPWFTGNEFIEKPRFGFNSKGISINKHDPNNIDCVVQRYIRNGKEFSVDCYYDKKHRMLGAIPRERIAVQGGEVIVSKTLHKSSAQYKQILDHVSKINQVIQFTGPICFQFIEDYDGKIYIMEINARFGGGVILSIEAGLDMIRMIVSEYLLNKEAAISGVFVEGMTMTRYFQECFYVQ